MAKKKEFKNGINQAANIFIDGTQGAQKVPGRAAKKDRFNMVFTPGHKEYLTIIARLEGCSITQYLNNLIEQDKQQRAEDINKAKGVLK